MNVQSLFKTTGRNEMTKLTPTQVDQITRAIPTPETALPEVRFIDQIDGRVWHVRSSSPLWRDLFMRSDYTLVDTTTCEDYSTFEPILNAWFGDEVYGEGTVTGMIFLPTENITFITYNGYGIDGLWTMLDTNQLMKGVIVSYETVNVYSVWKW